MVKIENQYMKNNPCYKAGKTILVKGLMLHSVGCNQENASVFIKQWNVSTYSRACVHGFIDNTGCYLTLPCMEPTLYSAPGIAMRGWHCGSGKSGSYNNSMIGIEMTEPSCIKYTSGANFTCSDVPRAIAFVKKNLENAVELFAQLCVYHNLNPLGKNVIVSHAEGNSLGYATAHADPDHLFRQLKMDYSMDKFRQEVDARVKQIKAEKEAAKNESNKAPSTSTPTTDNINEVDEERAAARQWVIDNGIFVGNGKDANGNPIYNWNSPLTRDQCALVMYRCAKMMKII